MNIKNQAWTPCRCVNTKTGSISTQAGKKPVLILELVTNDGELLIKFFNAELTPKGNHTTDRNSSFAKIYRLTLGENPQARFSRSDKLLGNFVGQYFLVKFEEAVSNKVGNYLRVTDIKPAQPIITDGWTITGHLIKAVRKKSGKNQSIFSQRLGKNQSIFGQFSVNDNSTQAQVKSGATDVLNPIQHPLSKIRASYIPTDYTRDSNSRGKSPLPDIDLASIEINQHAFH
jgi:hypothetical protein